METWKNFKHKALQQSGERNHNVLDMSHHSDDAIIEYFRSLKLGRHEEGQSTSSQFYGGITNDIQQNLSRHHLDDYIGCVKTDSKDTASRIEQRLQDDLGFDIGNAHGGNGATDDTVYVYMASKKPPFVK
jgi:hypothetical protein